jgi:DNA-binding transcriptional MerR regulator
VDVEWTLTELVAEAASSIATLPPPKNGQVRAVPDERTVRYYGTLGLLDRPLAMRGRTALYGRRHLAQVVAIKRLQGAGRSLAEIQTLWTTLDDTTLARMSGVDVGGKRAGRRDFWKTPPVIPVPAPRSPTPYPTPPRSLPMPTAAPVELRVELASGATLVLAVPADASISPADVAALRAAAAPLVTELARRGLTSEEP